MNTSNENIEFVDAINGIDYYIVDGILYWTANGGSELVEEKNQRIISMILG